MAEKQDIVPWRDLSGVEAAEFYARKYGWALSTHAPRIAEMVKKNGGMCKCKKGIPCPCAAAIEDVKLDGACHCNMFVTLHDDVSSVSEGAK